MCAGSKNGRLEIETHALGKLHVQPSWHGTATKVVFRMFPENVFLVDDKLLVVGRREIAHGVRLAWACVVRAWSSAFVFPKSSWPRRNRNDMGIDTLRVKTVLIVDKIQSVLDSSREFLETADFCVITASTGWEAIKLAMLCRVPIDVVLMDLEMPEMTAGDLAQRLRVLQPTVPIIFMSGSTGDAEDFAGAAFLLKPFSKRDLTRSIHAALKDQSQVTVFNRTGLRRLPY
jgi:CheY-like chemotaxis protein